MRWPGSGATACPTRRSARWRAPVSTRASRCRRGRRSTKRAGCWRLPTRTRRSSASSAGSICRRRMRGRSSSCLPIIRSWSASGTSSRASRTIASCSARRSAAASRCSKSSGWPTTSLCIVAISRRQRNSRSGLPRQRFVLDHLGKPDIRHGELTHVGAEPSRCSPAVPTCRAKLSGLVTEADWRPGRRRRFDRISTSPSTASAPSG